MGKLLALNYIGLKSVKYLKETCVSAFLIKAFHLASSVNVFFEET